LSDEINAEALTAIAEALLDRADAIWPGVTPRKALRLSAAVGAGQLSGAGTGTEKLMSPDGTEELAIISVDINGNRTSVALGDN
jgi:hypothetical protein